MKKRENIVMVPTDFSEVTNYAYDHAVGIAKQLDYKIVLTHIIDKETKSKLKKNKLGVESIIEKLDVIAKSIESKNGIKVEYKTREDDIFIGIGEVAEDIGAKLIIMGTHGKATFSQKAFRSFALRVVTNSTIPFIIVQEKGFEEGYNNIVFPITSTTEEKQKIQWAVFIGKLFNSKINILIENTKDKFIDNKSQKNADQIAKILKKNNIKYSLRLVENPDGSFANDVKKYSKEVSADMIMIMTVKDQLMPNFMLSFKDEEILFNASLTPVMCINPEYLDKISIGFNAL